MVYAQRIIKFLNRRGRQLSEVYAAAVDLST